MTLPEIDNAARCILPLLKRELSLVKGVYAATDPQGEVAVALVSAALAEFDRLILFARSAANGKEQSK